MPQSSVMKRASSHAVPSIEDRHAHIAIVQYNKIDRLMTARGRVSRGSPVQTAIRNCTRDDGRPFEVGNQVLISSHRKLLFIEVMWLVPPCREGRSFARSGSQRP
jgi:hypothetical protein